MARESSRRTRSRISLAPAILVFLGGLVWHAVDQALFVRAGPLPILVTAPAVATLLYLHLTEATTRRLLVLLAWGIVGSGLAVLGVYLRVVSHVLPRPLTGLEMVGYDLAMFLWFVLALAAAYVVAARARGRRATVAILLAPVAQVAFAFFATLLVASGLYA